MPRRCRYLRNLILLAFSLAFYACGGPKFLLLMLLSIAINYAGGLLAGPAHRPRTRRLGMTPVSYTHLDVYKRQVSRIFSP